MIVTPILKPIKTPQFGKQQLLTRLFREGKLPVSKDIYGIELTADTVSIEHLKPKSKGGANNIFNEVVADRVMNNQRGSRPLKFFIVKDSAKKYLLDCASVNLPEFDGAKYAAGVRKTLRGLDIYV